MRGIVNTPDGKLCKDCYVKSPHCSQKRRAKISIEIFTIAEIQRIAGASSVWANPTTWDCGILPGLSFKPDNMWAWREEALYETTGACKLIAGDITSVQILEIDEIRSDVHSASRKRSGEYSDEEREESIRNVFAPVPVDFVRMTVSAENHQDAHPDDVFFVREEMDDGSFEYSLIEQRREQWELRVKNVIHLLEKARTNKENETIRIGH